MSFNKEHEPSFQYVETISEDQTASWIPNNFID